MPIFAPSMKTNKTIRRLFKIVGGMAVAVVILLIAVIVTVSNSSFQKKLLSRAVEELQLKLGTHVGIDSVSINAFTLDVSLYGIEIEDLEKRKMLQLEQVTVDLELLKLLNKKVVIEKAEAIGANALLLKPSKDQPANYQFVIDAFKKPKDQKPEEKAKKSKMELDVSSAKLKDIHVKHNELDIYLGEASYSKGWITDQTVEAENMTLNCDTTFKKGLKPYSVSAGRLKLKGDIAKLVLKVDAYDVEYKWKSLWKKRNIMVDNLAAVGHLSLNTSKGRYSANVKGLRYKNDNHLPRKNSGRPKRGFFDAKHLDVIADFHLTLDSVSKDFISGEMDDFQARDTITGIDIRQLHTKFTYANNRIRLNNIKVQQKSTVLNITSGEIVLPSKKEGREFSYATGVITGRAYLADISRAFAPVLKNFKLPLNLSLTMKGTPSTISFRNVKVSTDDKKLEIAATGGITNLKDKYKLNVRFDINSMRAKTGAAEEVVKQFPIKKMMMTQLHNLGNINYNGSFDVLYKKVIFRGLLNTDAGNINFEFGLDGLNKYVEGKANTNALELGKVMNIKNLGAIEASANFKIDISKPRTALMRKQKGGKLPIGEINALVDDSKFKGIHIRNLSATIVSDGAIAKGDIYQRGKRRDIYFSFSFTNTDEMHKMKIISPGIKFHKMSEEDKAQEAERKHQKWLDKEDRKQLKAALKEQKRQQKAEEKELKRQQKAEEKERKRQLKAEKEEQENENDASSPEGEKEKKGFFKKLFSKKKKTETT